jgi:hypothetical protein
MASQQPGLSELEVLPLYRLARVPIYVTRLRSRLLLLVLLAIDIAFVAAHLAASLPSLDMGQVANAPWAWSLFKLAASGALAALMLTAHPPDRAPDLFWRLAAVVLGALALAEAAQLHALWALVVAPLVFGAEAPQLYGMLSRLLPLEIVVLGGIAASARRLPGAVAAFALAGLAFAAAESRVPAAIVEALDDHFVIETMATAWQGCLDTVAASLLLAAIAFAMRDRQAVSVRYVYRGG